MALRPEAVVGLCFTPLTHSSKCPLEARPVGSTEELLPGPGQGRAGSHGGRTGGTGLTDSPPGAFSDPIVPWNAPVQPLGLWEQVVPVTNRLHEGESWAAELLARPEPFTPPWQPQSTCPCTPPPPPLPRPAPAPPSFTDVLPDSSAYLLGTSFLKDTNKHLFFFSNGSIFIKSSNFLCSLFLQGMSKWLIAYSHVRIQMPCPRLKSVSVSIPP